MKNIKYPIYLFLTTLFICFNSGCTNLDEEVFSELDGSKFFDNPDNLIAAFGKAYTNLYFLGGHKFGMPGMEAGTDIAVVPQRGGDWFDGGEWHRWHRQTWTSREGYLLHWWNICFQGVNLCNQLIFQFEKVETDEAASAIAELRAFRALYYYWLIDIFGNVPIITEFDVPDDFAPKTASRTEVYNFVTQELEAVSSDLSKTTGIKTYGRITYYVAQTILAKLYLNAEVYTGTPDWNKAANACDEIINSGAYELASDYFTNFSVDGSSSKELLLAVPYDKVDAAGFEIHLFSLHYNLQENFGLDNLPWNGLCAQEGFYNSFEEEDIRRNGLLAGPQFDLEGKPITDPSYEKFNPANPTGTRDPDGPNLNLTPEINMLEPNCLRQAGSRIVKFVIPEGSDRYISTDFPIFRYADILLMKAEILFRGGDEAGALGLINQIRSRAGIEDLSALTLDDILAERGRELYMEGHRRSDMIRFGNYADARWEKEATDINCVKLWPIPEDQIAINPNLLQNPCY